MQPKLGIIAGGGVLPRQVIDLCRDTGRPFYVVAIEGHARPELLEDIPHSWIRIGTAGSGFSILKSEGVHEVVMIGDVKVPTFWQMRPDFRTAKFFIKVAVKSLFTTVGDNSLLTGAAAELEKDGFKVIGIDDVLDGLLAPSGQLGNVPVPENLSSDIAAGVQAALKHGSRDLGQGVVVKSGEVLLAEEKAGTEAMLKRAAEMGERTAGGVFVKLKKPGQDRRMDLPTIGVRTIEQVKDAGLAGIVIHAGETIIVDQAAVSSAADNAGIFVTAVEIDEDLDRDG